MKTTNTYRRKNRSKRPFPVRAKRFLNQNMMKIVIIVPLLVGMLAGMFVGTKATTYAQSKKMNDYGRQMVYKVYEVKSGDTVWGIAKDLAALNPEFNDVHQYMEAIEEMNGLTRGEITEGQKILIPYYVNMGETVDYGEIYLKYGITD